MKMVENDGDYATFLDVSGAYGWKPHNLAGLMDFRETRSSTGVPFCCLGSHFLTFIPTSSLPIDAHGTGTKSANQDWLDTRRLKFFRDVGPA